MTILSLPRGIRDLIPDEFERIEKVRSAFLEVARIFGFKVMEPSPLELLTTLEAKSGPGIRDEIFHFRDKGGRELGLRFDLTVGLTRYVASNRGLPLPAKLAAFGGMWRYDEPQYGRYRWFYQWDLEIYGCKDLVAEAEVLELTKSFLDRVGLGHPSIEVGDRRVVEEFCARKLHVEEEETMLEMMRALDKVGKRGRAQVVKEYSAEGVDSEKLQRLMDFASIKGLPHEVLPRLNSEGLEGAQELSILADLLNDRGMDVVLNMGIVRGIDYYTGTVFEIFDPENRDLNALAGGGRYDALGEIFGRPDLGAVGIAGGIERTLMALAHREAGRPLQKEKKFFVAHVEGLEREAGKLVSELRRKGLPAERDMLSRSLRKQMELANAIGSTYAVIVAPREYKEGKFLLRDLESGEERTIRMKDLTKELIAI